MDFLKLTPDKLDVGSISDLVADETCGAISLFVGTTRDNFEDKKVLNLEYVAYEPMAIKMMRNICADIREKWKEVCKIAIYHRTGLVPVKEASVVIAISSQHRKDSLDAVQYAIEELKKSVPIWKKEKYSTDEFAWKENKECSQAQPKQKRFKLDFDTCPVESETISQDLVQIRANESEIVRRIHCFVEKKREEIDLNNILDFTTTKRTIEELKQEENDENTCARTNTIVIKQADSKGHLRIRRVKNRIGPQIKPDYLLTLDKLMKNDPDSEKLIKEEAPEAIEQMEPNDVPMGIKERLQNIECHLNMKVLNPKHVYARIKAIENKILYLESISPEYKHFLVEKPYYVQESAQPFQKKLYSVDDIDDLIEELKTDIDREEQREEST